MSGELFLPFISTESDALEMDGDAVVNVRMETSEVTQGASEVIAYRTAVKLA